MKVLGWKAPKNQVLKILPFPPSSKCTTMGTLFGSSTHTGSFRKKGGDVMSHDVMALPMFSKVFPPRPEVQIRRVFPKKTSSRRFAGWVDGDGISWIFFWGKWNGKMMVC